MAAAGGIGQLALTDSNVIDALDVLYNAAAANSPDATTCEALRGHLNMVRSLMLPNLHEAQQRHRAQLDSRRFKFSSLLEALMTSRLVKNSKDLPEVLIRSAHFLFGSEISAAVQKQISEHSIKVPSESTLCRARLKLDVLAMLARQEELSRARGEFFTMVSTDSSPQGGLDYLMSLEDRVSRESAAQLMVAGAGQQALERWARDYGLETSQLPLAIVASGNSNLAGKYEALFHQVSWSDGKHPRYFLAF